MPIQPTLADLRVDDTITPDARSEIERRKALIQKRWSQHVRLKRTAGPDRPRPVRWEPKGVILRHLVRRIGPDDEPNPSDHPEDLR